MLFMISLAVAVLTGDAMLHLFPHVSTDEINQFELNDFEFGFTSYIILLS